MAKKQEDFLPPARFQPSVAPRWNHALTKAEQRESEEARNQLNAAEMERKKALILQRFSADIDESRFTTFAESTERMWAIKQQPRPDELQAIINHTFKNTYQSMDTHLEFAADMGVSQLMNIGQRPIYEPIQRKEIGIFRKRLKDV